MLTTLQLALTPLSQIHISKLQIYGNSQDGIAFSVVWLTK